MQHPRWREGALSTGFIREEYPDGFAPRGSTVEEAHVLGAVAVAIDHLKNTRRRAISQQMTGSPVRFAKRRVVQVGAHALVFDVALDELEAAIAARADIAFIRKSKTRTQRRAQDGVIILAGKGRGSARDRDLFHRLGRPCIWVF
jgi:acetyl/propionyl-CoA carboxylase alpha subunit